MSNKIEIELIKEEIEDLLENLGQCKSEGYLEYSDPAYSAMEKLQQALQSIQLMEKENGMDK